VTWPGGDQGADGSVEVNSSPVCTILYLPLAIQFTDFPSEVVNSFPPSISASGSVKVAAETTLTRLMAVYLLPLLPDAGCHWRLAASAFA
jgi:hypothetical protein